MYCKRLFDDSLREDYVKHLLVQCVLVARSDSCDPMDLALPVSSVHGILQARILERGAVSFSRGSSQPKDQTRVSCIAGGFFTI